MSREGKQNPLLEEINAKVRESIVPTPDYVQVPVSFKLSTEALKIMAQSLFSHMQLTLIRDLGFTVNELEEYLQYVVLQRIAYVNQQLTIVTKDGEGKVKKGIFRGAMRPQDHGLLVPAFLSLVLEQIGWAKDDAIGVELYPELDDSAVEFAVKYHNKRVEEVKGHGAIMAAFMRMESHGMVFAKGFSRDSNGSWDYMAMQCITTEAETEIKRHDKSAAPVYALLSSVLLHHHLNEVMKPRVSYGFTREFKSIITRMATL